MIGLGLPGRIRPWRLAAACSALRVAFPGAKVHIHHYDFRTGFADFVVHEAITTTDVREMLAMRPRRLRVEAEILNAFENDGAITALIAGVAPKMKRGAVVELGEIRQAEAKAAPRQERVIAEQPPTKSRPRVGLGRRVLPEELRQRLRGAVIR